MAPAAGAILRASFDSHYTTLWRVRIAGIATVVFYRTWHSDRTVIMTVTVTVNVGFTVYPTVPVDLCES